MRAIVKRKGSGDKHGQRFLIMENAIKRLYSVCHIISLSVPFVVT